MRRPQHLLALLILIPIAFGLTMGCAASEPDAAASEQGTEPSADDPNVLHADGFEAGDTSGWSTEGSDGDDDDDDPDDVDPDEAEADEN